jgi:hypothetical protein
MKSLLALFSFISAFANASGLKEKAPTFPFSFQCQLDVKVSPFPETAVTKFELDNENLTWVSSKETKWEFLEIRKYEFSTIISKSDQKPKNTFLPLEGQQVSLTFLEEENFSLSLASKWNVNGMKLILNPEKTMGKADSNRLAVESILNAKAKGKDLELINQLVCEKKKDR